MADTKVIIVDFDGALRNTDTGEPVEAMVKNIHRWLADGHDVMVFTNTMAGLKQFNEWEQEHRLGFDGLGTTVIDEFDELWSARSVQVEKNTGRRLVPVRGYGAGAV